MSNQHLIREGQYFNNYRQVKDAIDTYSAYINRQLVIKKSRGERDNYKYVVLKLRDCRKECKPHIRIHKKVKGPNKDKYRVVSVRSEHNAECILSTHEALSLLSSQIPTRLMYLGLWAY